MNILVIGGSGLLGSHTVKEALKRGHTVTILSRGNNAGKMENSEKIKHVQGDIYKLSDHELTDILSGQNGVVYALGIDARQTFKRPAYTHFHEDHVEVCLRVVKKAKACGIKKFVVFGSYVTYFDKKFPERKFADDHIYIKTRREQRDAVLNETSAGFDTFVFELPYVLGTQAGKVPRWTFLFALLAAPGKRSPYFMKGGTAAVTAVQVGQATINAMEQGQGGTAYPISGKNYKWTDFAKAYFNVTQKEKSLMALPPAVFSLFGMISSFLLYVQGKEQGMNLRKYGDILYMDAYIDPEYSMSHLGYTHDDYDNALSDVIKNWLTVKESSQAKTAPAHSHQTK